VEIAVGVVLGVAGVAVRSALTPALGDLAPYALNFVAMTLAAVIGGWRAGLVALIIGQLLAWFAIVGPGLQPAKIPTLIVATLTELMVLTIIGLYQREVDKGTRERDDRMALLDEALKEIDHRTRNNYQTVVAMIELQMRRAEDESAREALRQVCDRIQAIANASQQLAVRSADLGKVRLDDHLCGLVQQIEKGLSRDGIHVDCEVDDVTADADKATSISIIVNELVTNAIKHAFNGERSGRVWVKGKSGKPFELVVADDGDGIKEKKTSGDSGLGSRLVQSFARQLGAKHQVSSTEKGTTHRLLIPTLD